MLARNLPSCRLLRWRQAFGGLSYARAASHARHLAASATDKKKIVFLGTPEVAALVLKELLAAAKADDAKFEVAAVVSQPGKPKGRGNKSVPVPSPVEQLAREAGLNDAQILCPASAKEDGFLSALSALAPDLCVTAAYGNMLPTKFLNIPKHGTLNVHPSLLPKYRGAAPVPRTIQDGCAETGVSVAYTVLKCDAGPVLAQRRLPLDPTVSAPQLLEQLFALGARLLIDNLDAVWEGRAAAMAVPQDEAQATHAAKMSREEGVLDWQQDAVMLSNKIRAFAGWPGTSATFMAVNPEAGGRSEAIDVKVLAAAPLPAGTSLPAGLVPREVAFVDGRMFVSCGGGSVLEVTQLQPTAKKAMSAREFKNGLAKKKLFAMAPV